MLILHNRAIFLQDEHPKLNRAPVLGLLLTSIMMHAVFRLILGGTMNSNIHRWFFHRAVWTHKLYLRLSQSLPCTLWFYFPGRGFTLNLPLISGDFALFFIFFPLFFGKVLGPGCTKLRIAVRKIEKMQMVLSRWVRYSKQLLKVQYTIKMFFVMPNRRNKQTDIKIRELFI